MRLAEPYFPAMRESHKRIELRVADQKRLRVRPGDWIVFTCQATGAELTVRVADVRKYTSFADLYAHEDASAINSDMPVANQLAGVQAIYGPEREALGALAIAVSLEA
jgi:ASC-1-like (ASCH) protein